MLNNLDLCYLYKRAGVAPWVIRQQVKLFYVSYVIKLCCPVCQKICPAMHNMTSKLVEGVWC